jgi:hypothetical protein
MIWQPAGAATKRANASRGRRPRAIDNLPLTHDIREAMWIDGRRAFRPDSKYYRDTRRARLSGGPSRRGSMIGAIVAIVVVAIVATAYVLLKH